MEREGFSKELLWTLHRVLSYSLFMRYPVNTNISALVLPTGVIAKEYIGVSDVLVTTSDDCKSE